MSENKKKRTNVYQKHPGFRVRRIHTQHKCLVIQVYIIQFKRIVENLIATRIGRALGIRRLVDVRLKAFARFLRNASICI